MGPIHQKWNKVASLEMFIFPFSGFYHKRCCAHDLTVQTHKEFQLFVNFAFFESHNLEKEGEEKKQLPNSLCILTSHIFFSLLGPSDYGRRPRHHPERQDPRLLDVSDRLSSALPLCLIALVSLRSQLLHVLQKKHSQ